MSLDRAAALQMLPCYVCNDLPADAVAALEALLAEDDDLAVRLEHLRATRDLCVERLLEGAPELAPWPELMPAPAPVAQVPPTRPWGLLAGLAAAAALALSVAATPPEPAGPGLVSLHTSVASDDAQLLRAESPAALAAQLRKAGVSPQLAMVPDLSGMGFSLVGVRILGPPGIGTHPGVAVVYEKDGQRFVCQIQLATPTQAAPEATTTAAGVVLRAYSSTDGAVVSWHQGGRWCLFGGPADASELLAMVKKRMTAG